MILDAYSQVTGVPTPFNEVREGRQAASRAPTTATRSARGRMQLPDSQLVSRFLDAFGRPERVQTCSCERNAGLQRRPGAAPEQRQDAQRQAARQGVDRQQVDRRESRRCDDRPRSL